MDEIGSGTAQVDCDVLVIGGGTAGPDGRADRQPSNGAERAAAREGPRQALAARSRWAWTA